MDGIRNAITKMAHSETDAYAKEHATAIAANLSRDKDGKARFRYEQDPQSYKQFFAYLCHLLSDTTADTISG